MSLNFNTFVTNLKDYYNFMDISTIFKLLGEFGPAAVMFGFGLWGIYLNWLKAVKDQERAARKDDSLMEYFINELDKRDRKKQEDHCKSAEYRKEVIYKCHQFTKEIMKETGADNVAIYDYCNGSQNLAGIPFLHFRVISEKTSGLSVKSMYEKLDLNTLGVFLLDLEKEQTITIKNIKKEEDNYPELVSYMGLKKQGKGMFANIVGLNSALGFISVTFNHNKKVDYDKLEKVVFSYAQKVSNLLDYSNINL